MNKPIDPKSLEPFRVTTGPLPASTKRFSPAPGFPDVLVPYREIALHPCAKESRCASMTRPAPTPTPTSTIDVHEGLPTHPPAVDRGARRCSALWRART